MKIYLNKANENWILDRLRSEWYKYNKDISTRIINRSDIVWISSPWTWKKLSKNVLSQKKIVCSIYHIDFEKFEKQDYIEFNNRDKLVDYYHVISENSMKQLQQITSKKIISIPFWVNQSNWSEIKDKDFLKKKYSIPREKFIIGSFQRDSEGNNPLLPKLSKGPDNFIEIVKKLKLDRNLLVILTGRKRDYVINELENNSIEYKYFEMINQTKLNELYNVLDLYIVASRVEGGPQAILECALTKTPIISTDVGVAREVLAEESIFDMSNYSKAKPNIEHAYKIAQNFIIPKGFEDFRSMFFEN